MLDSLVRVSRRAVGDHYASILAEREPRPPEGYSAAGYNTPERATFPKLLSPSQGRCWPEPGKVHQPRGLDDSPGASLVTNASLSTISRAV